jgi:predicted membrane protein
MSAKLDLHEWLKSQVNDLGDDAEQTKTYVQTDQKVPDTVEQSVSVVSINRPLSSKLICHYLSLDRNWSTDLLSNFDISFVMCPYINNFTRGNVNIIKALTYVRALRLSDVYFYNTNVYSQQYSQLNVLVKELQTQSFTSFSGSKFHFVIEPQLIFTSYVIFNYAFRHSTYNYNRGWFVFNQIIKMLDTITINMFDRSKPINLLNALSYSYSLPFGVDLLPILYEGVTNATAIRTWNTFRILETPFNAPMPFSISNFNTTQPVADSVTINKMNGVHTKYISIMCRNARYDPVIMPILGTYGSWMWSIAISTDSDIVNEYKVTIIQNQDVLLYNMNVSIVCVSYKNGIITGNNRLFADVYTKGTVKTVSYVISTLCTVIFDVNMNNFTFSVVMNTAPLMFGSATFFAAVSHFIATGDTIQSSVVILPFDIRIDNLIGAVTGMTFTAYNAPCNMKLEVICEDDEIYRDHDINTIHDIDLDKL